jgi:hypothetical protein
MRKFPDAVLAALLNEALSLCGMRQVLATVLWLLATVISPAGSPPGPAATSKTNPFKDFLSVVVDTLRKRKRGRVLLPTLVALPAAYVGTSLIVPKFDDKFLQDYASFFQTSAQVIPTLLVAVIVEARLASAETELGIREAVALAVLWIMVAEVAAIMGLSPRLPDCLHDEAFRLTVSGGIAALVAILLFATRSSQRRSEP